MDRVHNGALQAEQKRNRQQHTHLNTLRTGDADLRF